MNQNEYLRLAVKRAKESVETGGFPAGAVLVKDGRIIAESMSLGFLLHDPTSHAEITAVREACKKLETTDLSGSVLYASLEPCVMCYCSSNWARISKIVYGCKKTAEMIAKDYYEGQHDIQALNSKSNYKVELEYISDYEEEMKNLIVQWEKSL